MPSLYKPMNQGEFISWSPRGTRFIYQDNFQVWTGAPGRAPARVANATSMVTPHWVSDTEIVAAQDTEAGWLLDATGCQRRRNRAAAPGV